MLYKSELVEMIVKWRLERVKKDDCIIGSDGIPYSFLSAQYAVAHELYLAEHRDFAEAKKQVISLAQLSDETGIPKITLKVRAKKMECPKVGNQYVVDEEWKKRLVSVRWFLDEDGGLKKSWK